MFKYMYTGPTVLCDFRTTEQLEQSALLRGTRSVTQILAPVGLEPMPSSLYAVSIIYGALPGRVACSSVYLRLTHARQSSGEGAPNQFLSIAKVTCIISHRKQDSIHKISMDEQLPNLCENMFSCRKASFC